MKLSATTRFTLAMVPLLAVLVAACVIGYRAVKEFTTTLETRNAFYAPLDAIGRVRTLTEVLAVAGRSAVVSGEASAIRQYEALSRKTAQELDNLKKLTSGSPLQQERTATLAALVREQVDVTTGAIEASKMKKRGTAARSMDVPVARGIRTILDRMEEDEQKALGRQSEYLLAAARRPAAAAAAAGGAAIAVTVLAYFFILREIRQRRRLERQSGETIAKLGLSVEHASDLVAITRTDGTIEYVNHAVEETTGYAKEELLGKTLEVLRSREHAVPLSDRPQPAGGEDPERTVTVNRKKSGEPFYLSETSSQLTDSAGKATHIIVTARDITRQRDLEDRVSFLERHDPLTGLPNRDGFQERLGEALGRTAAGGKQAVLVAAIDRFKYINDVFGSDAGNTVLKRVAERIREVVGDRGFLARLGSDEFGVLLGDIAQPADVLSAVGSIIENVSRGVDVDGKNVFVTLSIGAALHPPDGTDVVTLMKNADVAVAHAKAGGINSFRFYSADVNARMSELVAMEQQLFGALRNNEYEVAYQPYCDMNGKKIAGAEALIRWINRDLGVVAPARFIRTLESTGMIIDVGAWVLKTVCAQAKKMQGGKKRLPLSVNLSPAQFRHERLIEMVEQTIKAVSLDPRLIVLEVTESVFMEDLLFTQAVLKRLKGIGIAISIDDFGTGYSSLSYLKKLPVDVIKIDQSFVKDVTNDPDAATIITAITSMARSLGIKTIAEGVETEEQWKVLRLLRCDMGQGYYFSPALKTVDFERYLA